MNQADRYLPYLLKQYYRLQELQKKELSKLPPGQLSMRKSEGKNCYVQVIPANADGKRVRRGITKDKVMVQELARKKYLQKSLQFLENNIPLLEKLVAIHKAPTAENIIEALSATRAQLQLTEESFLPKEKQQNQWADADFEQSTYNLSEKKHITARGLKVRSKSEVIIAEKLDAYKIPFRYEQMVHIENQSLSPDFVILKKEELVYWEHCGLVTDPQYMKHHKWKLQMYEKAGIVPWKNLIVTYDDENGNLDARIIESEIINKLL